eukprot:s3390_g2.t1
MPLKQPLQLSGPPKKVKHLVLTTALAGGVIHNSRGTDLPENVVLHRRVIGQAFTDRALVCHTTAFATAVDQVAAQLKQEPHTAFAVDAGGAVEVGSGVATASNSLRNHSGFSLRQWLFGANEHRGDDYDENQAVKRAEAHKHRVEGCLLAAPEHLRTAEHDEVNEMLRGPVQQADPELAELVSSLAEDRETGTCKLGSVTSDTTTSTDGRAPEPDQDGLAMDAEMDLEGGVPRDRHGARLEMAAQREERLERACRQQILQDDVPVQTKRARLAPDIEVDTAGGREKQREKELKWHEIPDQEKPLYVEAELLQWNEHLKYEAVRELTPEERQLVEILKGVFGLSTSPKLWWLKLSEELLDLELEFRGEQVKVTQHPVDPCVFLLRGTCSDRTFGIILTHENRVDTVSLEKGAADSEEATPEQIEENRTSVGSLSWLAKQTRPDLQFAVASCQRCQNHPTVKDLKATNKAVGVAKAHKDAAWAWLGGHQVASQLGYLVMAMGQQALKGEATPFSLLDWRSKASSRVCRSTFAGETMSCGEGLESALYLRSLLVGMMTGRPADEEAAAWHVPIHLFTDCRSLYDHVHREGAPKAPSEKRLAIDLAAIRQTLLREARVQWNQKYGSDVALTPERPLRPPLHWVPTEDQLSDMMTKLMRPDNWWAACDKGEIVIPLKS